MKAVQVIAVTVLLTQVLPASLSEAEAIGPVPQPDGYRLDNFDARVPDALEGATRVSALDVRELQRTQNAVVVDVIPQHRRPPGLPDNQHWSPVPHEGLPGALWLPDTGMGALSDVTQRYFRRHLAAATDGQLRHPVVFYCRTDCWMSWNAAKRALSYGYERVYWFAEGTDDWYFEGFEFAILEPAPGLRQVGDVPDKSPR